MRTLSTDCWAIAHRIEATGESISDAVKYVCQDALSTAIIHKHHVEFCDGSYEHHDPVLVFGLMAHYYDQALIDHVCSPLLPPGEYDAVQEGGAVKVTGPAMRPGSVRYVECPSPARPPEVLPAIGDRMQLVMKPGLLGPIYRGFFNSHEAWAFARANKGTIVYTGEVLVIAGCKENQS